MSTGSSAQVTRRGVLPRLQDAKIRSKLGLILLVPLVAVVALGAARLVDIADRAGNAGQIQKLTQLSTNVSQLVQLLQTERIEGAQYLAQSNKAQKGDYSLAIGQTDKAIRDYREARKTILSPPDAVRDTLARIDDHLTALDETRGTVGKHDGVAIAEEVSRYGVVITDLIGYDDAISQYAGEGDMADGLRALAAFSRAKAGAGDQEAVAYAGRATGDASSEQRTALLATQTSQQEALLAFSVAASPAQRALVDGVVTGDAVNLADQVTVGLSRDAGSIDANSVIESYGAVVDLMRWAELQLESQLVAQAGQERTDVIRQAVIETLLVVLVLAVALALAVMLARSLNRSLRRLREGALAVANHDLPEAVARLRDARNFDGGVSDILREISDPIQLPGRDEIGQVAQAFNVVHREAVRIAAEQAALRTSVSSMFLNLARRSQSLVDRMIGELDQIERNETDPKRLAQLFELDHLATRMRRNDENLLVLAGADSSAPRREDALLVDAMRAAQSEVELYNRVEFGTVDTDIAIASHAVNDVVRLVAELLDNATRFSPPTTIVVADGRRIRDYVVVQVEDRGLGMSEEQMEQLNKRLAEPPSVDVAAFRLMGLAVVSRLAARYGIRVEMRANLEGGTVAQVILPNNIVVAPERQLERSMSARHATPELGAPPGWETSRSATATLPAVAPRMEPEMPAHPSLPQFPSQRKPVSPDVTPTPNRPPLPSRGAGSGAVNGYASAPNVAPPSPSGFSSSGFSPSGLVETARPYSAPPVPSAPPYTPPPAPAPVAERPQPPVRDEPASRWGAALAAMPPVPPPAPEPAAAAAPAEERTESPIFVEMQQSWFKDHDGAANDDWGMPTAGRAPEPAVKESSATPAPKSSSAENAEKASTGHNGSLPKQRPSAEERWQTAADYGWERAMAAADPVDAGTTRSGLPKRVPQAQLVPGGVQNDKHAQKRRSPDQVRGLLSAYHRGVQRGRTDGSAESAAASHVLKENEQ